MKSLLIYESYDGASEHFQYSTMRSVPMPQVYYHDFSRAVFLQNFSRAVILRNFFPGGIFSEEMLPGGILTKFFPGRYFFRENFPGGCIWTLPGGWNFLPDGQPEFLPVHFTGGSTGYSYHSVEPVGSPKTCIFTRWIILLSDIDQKWFFSFIHCLI